MKDQNRIPLYLRKLVAHVASTAAGCQYCQAHTIASLKMNGASEEKLNAVWEFETSEHFDDRERAALRFTLAAGTHQNAVTKEHYTQKQTISSDLK